MQKKTLNSIKKTTKKISKKTGSFALVIFAVFLILGLVIGYFAYKYIDKNEYFELEGEKEITLNVGDTYEEFGAKAKVLGKEVATEKIKIDSSSLKKDDNNKLTTAGKYIVYYTLDDIKYKDYVLYRVVIVEDTEEENNG